MLSSSPYTTSFSPFEKVLEIKYLEGLSSSTQTKPSSEFRGASLKGLWHKHFMPNYVGVVAQNIMNQLNNDKLKMLIESVIGSDEITEELINTLSRRIVNDSIEERAKVEKLTGEWIVFAKENDLNYYLCVCTHNTGDEIIAHKIKTACVPEFAFISKYVS